MEFLKYVKQRNRMMDSIGRKEDFCVGVMCSECREFIGDCMENIEIREPEKAEEIVQKWASEHPTLTNADKFKEVFGCEMHQDRRPCPPKITDSDCKGNCKTCLKWWDEEYRRP